jgi:hypothetical protein
VPLDQLDDLPLTEGTRRWLAQRSGVVTSAGGGSQVDPER